MDALDSRTRVLGVSHVNSHTGQCLNLPLLAEGARSRGSLFAVDATHASGVLRVPAELTDLTVSSSYKWMLATHGVAACYVSPRVEQQTRVTSFGWHNVEGWPAPERRPDAIVQPMPERMEPGNLSIIALAFLERALTLLLGIGIDRIENHARDLAAMLRTGLEKRGRSVMGPASRESLSGNTCFLAADADAVQERLDRREVLCRGEGGRVRISTHLYNGSEDVDRFLEVL